MNFFKQLIINTVGCVIKEQIRHIFTPKSIVNLFRFQFCLNVYILNIPVCFLSVKCYYLQQEQFVLIVKRFMCTSLCLTVISKLMLLRYL